MRRIVSIILLLFLIIWSSPVVLADPVGIIIHGIVDGPCNSFANVSIRSYCFGQLGNSSCSLENVSANTNSIGAYSTGLTYDSTPQPNGIEILVEVINTSCSVVAFGTSSVTSIPSAAIVFESINTTMVNPFTLDAPVNGSTVTNQTINFSWTNNILTPNSTIQIDNNSDFSSIDLTQSNIFDPNATLVTALLDGIYYWRVSTYINSNLIQQSGVNNFTLANSAPLIITISPNSTTWISSTLATLIIETDLPATCAYATSTSVAYNLKTPFTTTTGTTSHSTNINLPIDGVNNFYIQCIGSNGKLMPVDVLTKIYRDTSNPDESGASVIINSGAISATNSIINISWSGFTDGVSPIVNYYINITNNTGGSLGTFSSATSILLNTVSEGLVTVYVRAIDSANNIGLASSDTIVVDTQPPTYHSWSLDPININQFTTSNVILHVTISDTSFLPTSPQLRYKIGNDAYTSSADMTLVAGSIYSFEIPNQANPNNWGNRAGENLTFVVNATDASGFSSNIMRTMYINDQFNAPIFSAVSSFSRNQNSNISIFLNAFDVDGDNLLFSSTNGNITISSINSTAAFAFWSPTNEDIGTNILIFTVTDAYFNVSQAVIANITDINDDPVLNSIPDILTYEYTEFTYTVNASDVDGDLLSFSTNTSLFVISNFGDIRFTPTAAQRGIHKIEFTASDGRGGYDQENTTFTVLYCGDSICSSSYETSDSCELDCEIEDNSQGFIIDSKTCLGDVLSIKAVELVARATCPSKGIIINGWESCENLSDIIISVEQDIQDIYVSVTTLLTDEFGLASFTPNETGSYRLRYDNTDFDENIAYFSINVCSQKDAETIIVENSASVTEPEINLPFFEDPLTTEQIIKLSKTSKILYFILLPFLFVLLSVAAASTYYKYDKRKGSGVFSKELDFLLIKINNQLTNITTKVLNSSTYRQMKPYFRILEDQLVNVKQTLVKGVEPLIKNKNISIPFYGSQLKSGRENDLLLQSIYGFYFKSKKSANFAQALLRESLSPVNNLRDFCLNASKLGLPMTYLFSATKDKHELLLLHEKMLVKKSYPTFTDIKMEVLKGNPVLISLHMNSLNKIAPKQNFVAILTGYNKEGFFMLDYNFSRKKKTFIPLGVLQNSWNKTGYLECAIIKK